MCQEKKKKVRELAEDFHTQVVGTLSRSDLVLAAEEQGKNASGSLSGKRDGRRIPDAGRTDPECMQGGWHMLKRVGDREFPGKTEVFIKEAFFSGALSAGARNFNSPAHGNWNIVHTGMLVPEAQQIYVCADNCMRGVVLTAAEMNAADRFSFVIVEEKDLLGGNLEDVTIEGVTDVLKRLDKKPKAVLLFTVCLHHFLGSDLDRIYGELEKRFPEIFFYAVLHGSHHAENRPHNRIRSFAWPCMMPCRRERQIQNA